MKLLSNFFGIGSNATALYLNIQHWLYSVEVNKWLTIIISLLAIGWWLMKMYDQYLITRKRKEELKNEKVRNKKREPLPSRD